MTQGATPAPFTRLAEPFTAMTFNHLNDQLTPDNQLVGQILWEVLSSHIDFDCAGIYNQCQAKDFNAEQPQAVDFFWNYKRDPLLPGDFYTYGVKARIDSTITNIGSTSVILTVTDCDAECDLITERSYHLRLTQFLALLPQLHTKKRNRESYLSVLQITDVAEYDLTAITDAINNS